MVNIAWPDFFDGTWDWTRERISNLHNEFEPKLKNYSNISKVVTCQWNFTDVAGKVVAGMEFL